MKNELIIDVKNICGEHCVSFQTADKIFQALIEAFKENKIIKLDFKEVLTITSSFLNASIGKLYGVFTPKQIDENLELLNLDENDSELVNLVVKNARDHFKKDDAEKKYVDDVIKETINGKKDG